jgi:hypothetical protein
MTFKVWHRVVKSHACHSNKLICPASSSLRAFFLVFAGTLVATAKKMPGICRGEFEGEEEVRLQFTAFSLRLGSAARLPVKLV